MPIKPALLAHFNALENLQTRTHRQGAGATMLIASVVELGLQVVVLSGIVWVVTGTLNLAFFDCRRRDDYALRRTDGDVYQLHLGCGTDRQRPATD